MIMALDERMKNYEKDQELPINIPIILRIDGRAFHTFTRGMQKPFDDTFIAMMNEIGLALCEEIQNCRMAYLQSDEISFLIYNRIDSSPWFGNKVQKMVSVSASLASSYAMRWIDERKTSMPRRFPKQISFDARANIYPEKDVTNYFIWRQSDWERNSVQMVARSHYSQKELQGKNNAEMHELIYKKGANWNDYPTFLKRGRCIIKVKTHENIVTDQFTGTVERNKWIIDNEIPIFTKNRDYIEGRLRREIKW